MSIPIKWFYRLGFILLLFVVLFIFIKLKALWIPIGKTIGMILFPFFVSGFITYLLHPIVEKLEQENLPRWLSITLIYGLFFGGLAFLLYKGIPAFVVQLKDLVDNMPYFTKQYRDWIVLIQSHSSAWPELVQNTIDDGINAIEKSLNSLMSRVVTFIMRILNMSLILALIPFITFYMLKDIDEMKKMVWFLTPRKWRVAGQRFLRDVDASLGGYIRGQLLVGVVIGSVAALLFWVFNMKYPLLLGFIVGITNIIPYFGPVIALVPIVIIAATISMKMVLTTVIIIFALQFVEGNILSPLIVGKSLHMHPLLIMFALLAGGEMGGIVGLIVAVPILAVLKVSIIHGKNHFTVSAQIENTTRTD